MAIRGCAGEPCLSLCPCPEPRSQAPSGKVLRRGLCSLKMQLDSSGKAVRAWSKQRECYPRGRQPLYSVERQVSKGKAGQNPHPVQGRGEQRRKRKQREQRYAGNSQGKAKNLALPMSCSQTGTSQSRALKMSNVLRVLCTIKEKMATAHSRKGIVLAKGGK